MAAAGCARYHGRLVAGVAGSPLSSQEFDMAHSLMRSTAVVSAMTLLSRGFGFLRDLLMARAFGAGPAMDAFFVAFKIPNFLRRLFAEGSFSQAFIPVLAERRAREDLAEVRAFADRVAGTLGGVLLVITVLGVVFAPVLILLFAPGFDDSQGQRELAIGLLRITFPYLLFISLTAFASGLLNTYGQFGVPAFTPVLLNLCLIAATLWVAPHMAQPVYALAWGVFIAGVLQLAFQLPFLARQGLLPRPRWGWHYPPVRRVMTLMVPTLFGSSVAQVNLLVDTLLASLLAVGSVSWLYYADRLMEFPLGVFGIALSTVILPHLSARHAEADPERFSATLDWALRGALLISLPAAVMMGVIAHPLLATLFHGGAFTDRDVAMSAAALATYGLGLTGFILVKVLVPGYYARQDTRAPVRIGLIAMGVNTGLNLILLVPAVQRSLAAPHAFLALSTSVAAYLNALLLYRGLRRSGAYLPSSGWARFLTRMGIANGLIGLGLWWWVPAAPYWVAIAGRERLLALGVVLVAVALAYPALLLLLGMRPRHFRLPSEGAVTSPAQTL